MANHWLVKSEPGVYSYADLERDGETVWDGVSNALALQHLRAMRPGDLVMFYHTGGERQVVGVAAVTSVPYPDPNEADGRLVVVELKPVERLPRPVTLAEIKADPAFADWELVRLGRLSVMPVQPALWRRLVTTAKNSAGN